MNDCASRYSIRQSADGFVVVGKGHPAVEVSFRTLGITARYAGEAAGGAEEWLGFFNFSRLLDLVARGLMRDWRPHDDWFGARARAQQQAARAIARRLREQWLRLLGWAEPRVLSVQRAIIAATLGDAVLSRQPALYEDRYLVRDVIAYPAAAIAVRNAWALARDLPVNRLLGCAAARDLREQARRLKLPLVLSAEPPEPNVTTQLERLRDWRALFSDTGESYRSLNRTLMNLPAQVPHRLVCKLRHVHLERPLVGRLEMLVVSLYAGIRAGRDEALGPKADHGHLLQHAGAAKLREAMSRLSAHLRQPLDARKVGDVRQLAQYLADYPLSHAGNVVGLTERAIRWHRDRQRELAGEVRREYGAEMETMRPAISLPGEAGVTFLGTVGEICTEAERMGHCVASYADLAVRGACYLFHVEHGGEEATVEVGNDGRVRQSQGPHNRPNCAAAHGRRVLNGWAAGLRCGLPSEASREEGEVPF